eukprot:10221419-Ditylum_brightwellii.AAC.1
MGSKQCNSNKAEPHNDDGSDKCYHYYKNSSRANERKRGKLCGGQKRNENTGGSAVGLKIGQHNV